jgi:hypothetical protein
MDTMMKKLGSWIFLIGVCVALLVGFIFGLGETLKTNLTSWVSPLSIVLAVLGFLVGVFSFFALGAITQERVPTFLIASLILVALAVFTSTTTWTVYYFKDLAPIFSSITKYLAIFVAPAALIVIIRALWDTTQAKQLIQG